MIDNKEIVPNCLEGKNHVYKIICGAGKHSADKTPKLKIAIPKFLENRNYDFHSDMGNGVFLIRLMKK